MSADAQVDPQPVDQPGMDHRDARPTVDRRRPPEQMLRRATDYAAVAVIERARQARTAWFAWWPADGGTENDGTNLAWLEAHRELWSAVDTYESCVAVEATRSAAAEVTS